MSVVSYRPSESPVAQMSAVAGLISAAAARLNVSTGDRSVLIRVSQQLGSSTVFDVYRSVDGVVQEIPMVSDVSDAFYLSVALGSEDSILVLSLQAEGYYPVLCTLSYFYSQDLLFISESNVDGMSYKTFNSTMLLSNLEYSLKRFVSVPDMSINTLPKVLDFLRGFVTTDNLKEYIGAGGGFAIVQGPGSSTTAVMSQNAVTQELLQKVGVDAIVDTTGNSSNLVMSQASVTEELSKKVSSESVASDIATHNTSSTAHGDIRQLLNTCVGLPAYDSSSYKITFTTLAGATAEIDLPIEQLALRYNAETESIEFDNHDGSTTSIPVSAFVKEYVGSIGDQIQISIDENNVIRATVLKNSIDWDCLSVELQERINDLVTSVDFAEKVVRTDISQSLSLQAQNQALENIGSGLVILDVANGVVTLTAEQETVLLSSTGVILRGSLPSSNATSVIFHAGSQGGSVVTFYALHSQSEALYCTYKKESKEFAYQGVMQLRDSNAVLFGASQQLTASQMVQAYANLGLKVYVTTTAILGTTVSDEVGTALRSARIVLFEDTGDVFSFGNGGNASIVRFYSFYNSGYVREVSVTEANVVSSINTRTFVDNFALHFTDQSLTEAQKNIALSNIGLDFVRIPYSLLGTALTGDTLTAVQNCRGLIVVQDGTTIESVFLKGGTGTNTVYFAQVRGQETIGVITLNTANNILSSIARYQFKEGCVRADITQDFSNGAKERGLNNLGWGVHVVSESVLGSDADVSDGEKELRLNARAVLVSENKEVYTFGISDDTYRYFYRFRNVNTVYGLRVDLTTGKFMPLAQFNYHDPNALWFGAAQNLTEEQQAQARSNIGVKSASELAEDADFAATLTQGEDFGVGTALNNYFIEELLGNVAFLNGLGSSPEVYEAYMQSLVQDASVLTTIAASPSVAAIRYVAQTLSATQKLQARTNIDAARGQVVQNVTGSTVTLAVVGGTTYLCGELSVLTITSLEDSTDEAWIYFTSGATATNVVWPTGTKFEGFYEILPDTEYEICIRKSRVIIAYTE